MAQMKTRDALAFVFAAFVLGGMLGSMLAGCSGRVVDKNAEALASCSGTNAYARSYVQVYPFFCEFYSDDYTKGSDYLFAECNKSAQTENGPYELEIEPDNSVVTDVFMRKTDDYCGYKLHRSDTQGDFYYEWQDMICDKHMRPDGERECYFHEVTNPDTQ